MGGITDMFKKPKQPEAIKMPDPEDPTALEAKRRDQARRKVDGRASTDLASGGSGTYSNTLLG